MVSRFSTDKRKLISNFLSLSSVEAANYILPLITVPYLVRVLGPSKFGLIAFAQAVTQYFVLLTDYGFNLSATRLISIHRHDTARVCRIFNAVITVKLALMALSCGLLASLIILIPKFRADAILYIFVFGTVIGNVLFPIWFFQGMERMKFIAVLNLFAKLIFVAAIFIFIKAERDYIYVPLITSAGFIVAGIASLLVIAFRFRLRYAVPHISDMFSQLKEGWHIFISTAAISMYTTSNTVILGFLTNNTIVGYYSAAERIIRAGQRLMGPISQTIYPHITQLVSDSQDRAVRFIRKALLLVGGGGFIVSVLLFAFSGIIVHVILGPQYQDSLTVLRILAFLPFIIALSNIFGIQTMLAFNMKQDFSRILLSAGFINIPLALILIPLFQHTGLAAAVVVTELFVTGSMYMHLRHKGIFQLGLQT